MQHVRAAVVDLRNRLQDIKTLLHSVTSGSDSGENAIRTNVGKAIQAIQAVSEDLATVCDDQPEDTLGRTFQQTKAKEAKSEVDSGEFDSQG